MNDPSLMRRLQRLGDLLRNRQRLIQRDRPLRDAVSQGRTFNQLQHQRPLPLGFLDAENGGDVGVVEAGEDLRLPREPGEPIRISREAVREDLQRDLAVELGVRGLPDLAHAAFPKESSHVIVAEPGTSFERHGLLKRRNGLFYAGAGDWLQRVHSMAPRRRTQRGPTSSLRFVHDPPEPPAR